MKLMKQIKLLMIDNDEDWLNGVATCLGKQSVLVEKVIVSNYPSVLALRAFVKAKVIAWQPDAIAMDLRLDSENAVDDERGVALFGDLGNCYKFWLTNSEGPSIGLQNVVPIKAEVDVVRKVVSATTVLDTANAVIKQLKLVGMATVVNGAIVRDKAFPDVYSRD